MTKRRIIDWYRRWEDRHPVQGPLQKDEFEARVYLTASMYRTYRLLKEIEQFRSQA